MASWVDVEAAAPELAAAARELLDARKHKTIATLRRDGSPRISGIEAWFEGGELWFGAMWRSVKALDLLRDPRFSLHSGAVEPPAWEADAKVTGRAEEAADEARREEIADAKSGGRPEDAFHLFRAEVSELAVVRLSDARDALVIDSWREGGGVRQIRR